MSNFDSSEADHFPRKERRGKVASDELVRLREILLAWPMLTTMFGDILQLRVVVDANIVFEQLNLAAHEEARPRKPNRAS